MTIPESAIRQRLEGTSGISAPVLEMLINGYRQLIEDLLPHDLAVIDRIVRRYLSLD